MTLPASDIATLYEDATKMAKYSHDGGKLSPIMLSPHTMDSDDYLFPEDFRIFVFDDEPAVSDDEVMGIVISKQRGEVIFFAEERG